MPDDVPAITVVSWHVRANDGEAMDGVGVRGRFTMDSPSDDVVSYGYGFRGGPSGTVSAERPGAAATVPYLPLTEGPEHLTVRAIDRSGRSSGESSCDFDDGRIGRRHPQDRGQCLGAARRNRP